LGVFHFHSYKTRLSRIFDTNIIKSNEQSDNNTNITFQYGDDDDKNSGDNDNKDNKDINDYDSDDNNNNNNNNNNIIISKYKTAANLPFDDLQSSMNIIEEHDNEEQNSEQSFSGDENAHRKRTTSEGRTTHKIYDEEHQKKNDNS